MKIFFTFVIALALVGADDCGQSSQVIDANTESQQVTCKETTREQISSFFIVPGHSVGDMRLGDSKDLVIQNLDKCARPRVVDYPAPMKPESWISIPDPNINTYTIGNGISAFIEDGKIVQIKVDSYLYSDQEITKNSLLPEVRAKYPSAQLYKLIGSADINQSGSVDLLYLVDSQKGVAFEFYETRFKDRKVSNIYVFEPNTDFFPFGTLNASKFLKRVKI